MSADAGFEFDVEADGRHICEFPSIPGAMAYGATREEAASACANLIAGVMRQAVADMEAAHRAEVAALVKRCEQAESARARAEQFEISQQRCAEDAERSREALRAEVARLVAALEVAQAAQREHDAKVCERMVIGGRAWTEEQAVAADALFAAAKNIREGR